MSSRALNTPAEHAAATLVPLAPAVRSLGDESTESSATFTSNVTRAAAQETGAPLRSRSGAEKAQVVLGPLGRLVTRSKGELMLSSRRRPVCTPAK